MSGASYLKVVVPSVAIRDEPGSTDRIGDFGEGDAVKLAQPIGAGLAVPEWVEVDMVGAVREPVQEGVERPSTGFVRTRNRVRGLLAPWGEADGDAGAAHAAQANDREGGTSWFKSATRTAATAAQHARPLLKGGLEEYEQRQKLHLAAKDLVERRAAESPGEAYDVARLKRDLEDCFGHAPWLEPYVREDHMVHTLMMVAKVDADRDARAAKDTAAAADAAAAAPALDGAPPPPQLGDAKGVLPPASPLDPGRAAKQVDAVAARRRAVAAPGDAAEAVLGAARALASPGLQAVVDDAEGALAELWVRLPLAV